MQKLFTYLLLILLLSSCEEQTDWDLKTINNDFIVVDGIITNEMKVHSIILSKPVTGLNDPPEPVSAATVLVSSNQLTYTFHEDPLHPGRYLSDNAFLGIKNRTYSLLITSGNKVYSSKAVLAPPITKVEFVFLRYQKNGNDNKYRITWVANQYNPLKPAMFEILLDWSTAPGYENESPESCKAKLYYYALPTLDVSEIFAPTLEKVTFPYGTVITERRYSLTDEHAAFIRAVLLETNWQGGYFNTASANIPTNLSEGAMGFFGACGVVEDQKTVE
jgi:hypothetical protein